MKKITFLFLLSAICLLGKTQVSYSIFAGPQMTTARHAVNGTKQDTKNKFGFQAGAGMKIPFENNLYFAPVAFYSMKGYKVNFNRQSLLPDTNAINNDLTVHTFELAPLLQYDFKNTPGHFFIKAGPSLDFQLFGKEKFTKDDNTVVDRNMKFSFGDYGRVAANAIIQFGYETKNGLLVFAQYAHGIGGINNVDDGPAIRHRTLGLSIGKTIGCKKK